MTDGEKSAMDKAVDALTDGFNGLQSLQMSFAVCSSICKVLIAEMGNDEQQDKLRRAIRKNYIDILIDELKPKEQ